jgi:hypothetical protein
MVVGTLERCQRWADPAEGWSRSRETGNKRIYILEEGQYNICAHSKRGRTEAGLPWGEAAMK